MPADLGQDLLQQKSRIAVAESVVFKTAVIAERLPIMWIGQDAGTDEHSDGHRHFSLGYQIVEDNGDPPITLFLYHSGAVLKHHDTGRLARLVLSRHIDPVIADRAR